MAVFVDRSVCYGSADCAHRVPDVFEYADGYGAVLPGREDSGDDPRMRNAAESCPSQAIQFTDGTTAADSESPAG